MVRTGFMGALTQIRLTVGAAMITSTSVPILVPNASNVPTNEIRNYLRGFTTLLATLLTPEDPKRPHEHKDPTIHDFWNQLVMGLETSM